MIVAVGLKKIEELLAIGSDDGRLGKLQLNILGKSGAVATVAITDPNFAEEIGRLAVSE